jgi:hypothetical protein
MGVAIQRMNGGFTIELLILTRWPSLSARRPKLFDSERGAA